jgi:hypothetical protein
MRESQRENPIGILLIDVRLSSAFPIIGSTNTLNNRTIGIGYFPHLLLNDLRKATDKTVDVSDFFHFSFLFLSFSLTSYIDIIPQNL